MKHNLLKLTVAISVLLLAIGTKAQTNTPAYAYASIVHPVAVLLDTEMVSENAGLVIAQIKLDASMHEMYAISLPEELEMLEKKSGAMLTIQIVAKDAYSMAFYRMSASGDNRPASSWEYENDMPDQGSNPAITINFN